MADGSTKAEAFLRHLEPVKTRLERYCRRSLHDANATRDVLQTVLAKTFADFHLFAEGTNFLAWIFRYLHLEIMNWNRKFQRDQAETLPELQAAESWPPLTDEPLFEILLEDPEIVLDQCGDLLAQAIRDLPALQRSSFLLLAVGGFKYREIAEILDAPLGTVMSGISRARSRLRARLVEYGKQNGFLHLPEIPSEEREGVE